MCLLFGVGFLGFFVLFWFFVVFIVFCLVVSCGLRFVLFGWLLWWFSCRGVYLGLLCRCGWCLGWCLFVLVGVVFGLLGPLCVLFSSVFNVFICLLRLWFVFVFVVLFCRWWRLMLVVVVVACRLFLFARFVRLVLFCFFGWVLVWCLGWFLFCIVVAELRFFCFWVFCVVWFCWV